MKGQDNLAENNMQNQIFWVENYYFGNNGIRCSTLFFGRKMVVPNFFLLFWKTIVVILFDVILMIKIDLLSIFMSESCEKIWKSSFCARHYWSCSCNMVLHRCTSKNLKTYRYYRNPFGQKSDICILFIHLNSKIGYWIWDYYIAWFF